MGQGRPGRSRPAGGRDANKETVMAKAFAILCTVFGYLEAANLLLTGNLISLPCALAAFGVARGLRGLDREEAEAV